MLNEMDRGKLGRLDRAASEYPGHVAHGRWRRNGQGEEERRSTIGHAEPALRLTMPGEKGRAPCHPCWTANRMGCQGTLVSALCPGIFGKSLSSLSLSFPIYDLLL